MFFAVDKYAPLCEKCKRYKRAKNPKIEPSGKGEKKILIITNSPSMIEDHNKQYLSDTAGKRFDMILRTNGMTVEKDCTVISACKCYSKQDATLLQIDCCSPTIKKAVETYKPNHIWILGKTAFNAYIRTFYPKRFKSEDNKDDDAMTLWRKRKIPCPKTKAWIYPMWHPNALDTNKKNQFFEKIYIEDLKWVISHAQEDKPVFTDWYKDKVSLVVEHAEVVNNLNKIKDEASLIFFDYETTGLKPYNKKHKIISIAITSYDKNKKHLGTISFPFCHSKVWNKKQYLEIKDIWIKILENGEIKKVAHNAKFENLWTRVCLKTEVKGWHFCTQLASYVLDERHKSSGLKFQSFVRWGIPDYDKAAKEYLSAEGSNAHNKAEKAPLDLLLLYNGIDAELTARLYFEQRDQLKNEGLIATYRFMFDGIFALSELEIEGFPVSRDHFAESDEKVKSMIIKLDKELMGSYEVREFEKRYGRSINLESSADIRKVLFEILKLESEKKTKKGIDAVDKNTLIEIDHPWCKTLLQFRKYKKIKSTYVDQFIREINDDDKIHPFFSQTTTRSGRSSSQFPNSQNMPSRDDESKQLVKKGFIVSNDEYFVEIDYGSLEVRIAACFTKDPVLIKYINDPSTDMHRDTAMDLFKLDPVLYQKPEYSGTLKKLRYHAKNGFIFPVFYGSYWRSCARNLWKDANNLKFTDDYPVIEYLKERMIGNYTSFEEHIKATEDKFWKKFHVFRKWQEESKQFYIDNGYVYTMFGFRRRGLLSQNMVLNTGIQGSGFQCLLWSLIRITKNLRSMQSKVMGQIHDSVLCRVNKNEVSHVLSNCVKIMEDDIKANCKWMVVPMIAEIESSELGGSWYDKKPIDIEKSIAANKMIFT